MGSHPIYVAPATVKFIVSPAEYPSLISFFRGDKGTKNFVDNGNSGSVTVDNIDFTWEFDGEQYVSVTIVTKHGMMRWTPNATIFDMLGKDLEAFNTKA